MTYQHTEIPLSDIKLLRPERQYTDGESLQELADSIKSLGLLQPVLVRYSGDGYELIAGERRLKAFQLLSDSHPGVFQTIPGRIIDSEQDPAVLSLVENIQRLPLTALEESNSLYELIRITSKGYADLGKLIGKGEDYVENRIRFRRIHGLLKNRIAPYQAGGDFMEKLDKLSLAKGLAMKCLTSHWTDEECHGLLNAILDEDMTLREIRALLSAHNEKRVVQRLSPAVTGDDEFSRIMCELEGEDQVVGQDSGRSGGADLVQLMKSGGTKKKYDWKPLFSGEFWAALMGLYREKLCLSIREERAFQKGLWKLNLRYTTSLPLNS